ncbi:MAG: sulfatase-like hydrolase/transferase [Spirochaetes bacterium]|nr:sulfatase-like hydrolase/transferase [Spirochaetota bacterium]
MNFKINEFFKMIYADFKLNIKKILIVAVTVTVLIYLINFFGNIKNAEVVENVSISISITDNNLENQIKVLKIDNNEKEFYINKSIKDNKWTENKNYIKKIIIEAPDNFKDQIEKISVNIGTKNFIYSKDDFSRYWKTIDKKQDIIKSGVRYKFYHSPADLFYKKSIVPLKSGIINWPGDFKIILFTFNSTFLIHMILILMILVSIFILKEIIKFQNRFTDDHDKIMSNEKFSTAVILSCFFSSIFFFGPFHMFFTNFDEFDFTFVRVLPLISIGFIMISFLFILFILFLYKFKSYRETISLIFVFALLLWIQGNILVWKYGIFDGSDIKWNKFFINGLIDIGIWIIFIFIAVFKSKLIYKNIKTISIIVIIMQLSLFVVSFFKLPELPGHKKYSIDKKPLFEFSKEKNVVLFTLDDFQSNVFYEIIEEDAYYKDIFKDFIFYDDCITAYYRTEFSVPTFLTGTYYDGSRTQHKFVKEEFMKQSIPKLLIENGFRVDIFPQNKPTILFDKRIITNIMPIKNIEVLIDLFYLYDITLFRYLPHFAKKYIYNNGKWLLRRIFIKIKYLSEKKKKFSENLFNDHILQISENVRFITDMVLQSNANNNSKCFKYYHINGAHPPFHINENFELVSMKYSKKNYKNHAKSVLKAVKMFLDKLKEIEVFNDSLIIIHSDHGSGRSQDMLINYNKEKINNDQDDKYKKQQFDKTRSQALFLIKTINYKNGFKVDKSPVMLTDIPKTIASELNLESTFSGYSVFDKNIPNNRKRPYHGQFNQYIITGPSKDDSSWEIIKEKDDEFTAF